MFINDGNFILILYLKLNFGVTLIIIFKHFKYKYNSKFQLDVNIKQIIEKNTFCKLNKKKKKGFLLVCNKIKLHNLHLKRISHFIIIQYADA